MKSLYKAHYMFQYYVAAAVAPVLRVTGWRFGKAWRGNWIVNHVEANMRAEGWRFSKAWRDGWIVHHVEANMRAEGFDVKPIKFSEE